jgi:hypothetical protein
MARGPDKFAVNDFIQWITVETVRRLVTEHPALLPLKMPTREMKAHRYQFQLTDVELETVREHGPQHVMAIVKGWAELSRVCASATAYVDLRKFPARTEHLVASTTVVDQATNINVRGEIWRMHKQWHWSLDMVTEQLSEEDQKQLSRLRWQELLIEYALRVRQYRIDVGYRGSHSSQIEHIEDVMLPEMRAQLMVGAMDKFFRWLGFVQGIFWSAGIYTIEQMREHNRGR